MLKICIVASEYFPVPAVKGGAIETLVQSILDENEKHHKIDIVCITRYNKLAKKLYNNYKYTKFIPVKIYDTRSLIGKCILGVNYILRAIFKYDIKFNHRRKKYEKLIKGTNADLVVFEGQNDYISESLTSSIGKEKMVLHLHKTFDCDLDWEKKFQYFIAISNYVKQRFSDNGKIPEERISVVYNGIDLSKFDRKFEAEKVKELKHKYNIPTDKKIIIYTGRLIQVKGVKELIEAFKKCKKKNDSVLLICGGSPFNNNQEDDYIKEIKKIAKNENVIFTGYIDNKELYLYYQMADFAVFPSLWEEGFGNVVIEAMLNKKTVIISKRGGMQELVSDKTGIAVPLDDSFVENLSKAIDKMISDDSKRKELGNNAYNYAKSFSQENYYDNYVKTIQEFVNGGSNG